MHHDTINIYGWTKGRDDLTEESENINDKYQKIPEMYGAMAAPMSPTLVLAASGKPSTWLPLGGLVEQALSK